MRNDSKPGDRDEGPEVSGARDERFGNSEGPSVKISVLLVLAAVALGFGNALGGEFVWDDRSLIEENPLLDSWANVPGFFVRSFEESSGPGAETSTYYRPLVLLSYRVDRAVWGLDATGYHLTNLLLHGLASLFVFSVGRSLFGPIGGLFGGLLFAVHPIHTESVTWISGRTDLLASCFLLGSLAFYLRARPKESWNKASAVGLGMFSLALLSKEIAFVFPIFLGLIELLWRREGALIRVLPHFGVLALFGVFYAGIVGMNPLGLQAVDGFAPPALGLRCVTAGGLVLSYAGKVIFPWRLNAEWEPGWSEGGALGWGGLLFGCILLTGCLARWWRREPILVALVGWFLLFLLPVLNLLPIKEVAAERFAYLPSAALSGLVGFAVVRLGRRFGSAPFWLVGLTIVGFGARTVTRNLEWRDGLTLFEVTAAQTRDAPRARFNLAKELHRQGLLSLDRGLETRGKESLRRAHREYREVLALGHTSVAVYLALAEIHLVLDEIQEALDVYREGMEVRPDAPDLPYALAELLFQLGEDSEARTLVEQILESNPGFTEARRVLGILAYRAGEEERAEKELRTVLEAQPDRPEVYQVLGVLYGRQRRIPEAVMAFQKSLELDPTNLTSMGNLAKIFVHAPPGTPFYRPKDALVLIQRAIRYEPRPEFLQTLVKALVGDRQFEKAKSMLEAMIEVEADDREELKRLLEWVLEAESR